MGTYRLLRVDGYLGLKPLGRPVRTIVIMNTFDTRHAERDSMFLMADIVFAADTPATKAKVRNLSAVGMMVESEVRVQRGQRIAAELRNIGPVAGVVVWIRGGRFGVAFDEEIDPKLARTPIFSGSREAPGYARAALDAPRHDGWNGKLRRI